VPEVTVSVGGDEHTFDTKKEMLKAVGRAILSDSEEPMTLRQLYYRFVAMDLIENKQSQYQYLGEVVKEARLEGVIPWGWIEDRTRSTDAGDWNDGEYVDPDDWFERNFEWFKNTPERYHRPKWEDQRNYIEVWVEKEALAGVFANVCEDLKVVSFPNRGYTSITMLKQAAERIRDEIGVKVPPDGRHRRAHILYFGDFDPSGQDIERNIREKFSETFNVRVNVERIALTREQIDEFELPPQPAKRTDARYESFVEEHGNLAVELDALPPDELRRLIRESVDEYFDESWYQNKVKPKEEEERDHLRERVTEVLCE
jgi:hypothetical protein